MAVVPVKAASAGARGPASRDEDVKVAVLIVIHPGDVRTIARCDDRRVRYRHQMAFAVVMPENVLCEVANKQIDEAVVVVIGPGRTKGQTQGQAGLSERAIDLLLEKESWAATLPRDEKIDESVIVEVGPGRADRPHACIHNGTRDNFGKHAVAVVPIKQIRSRAVAADIEVEQAVIVEIHP